MNLTQNTTAHAMQANAAEAAALLKSLAHPARLLVLCTLVKGEKPVGDLVYLTGLSHSALSQHLAKLRAQKLVRAEKRGLMVYYQLASPEVEAILSTLYLIYCRK